MIPKDKEQIIEIKVFQTCEKNGSESKAPFLSKKQNRWLTQGYYFWTDCDYFAHKWGEDSYKRYDKKYCIFYCALKFDKKKELLDLVGNVDNQLYFAKIYNRVITRLKKSGMPVGDVINYLRELNGKIPGAFSYKAIKAVDNRKSITKDVQFVKNREETMKLGPTRQQLCVFDYNFPKGEILYE